MDIVVCVKTNPDLQMVRIKNREAVLEAVPYKLGDLEKNALEAAVALRDAAGGKVVALCLAEGNRKVKETIKEALAMGADEAVVVDDPALAAARPGGGGASRSPPPSRSSAPATCCCSARAPPTTTPGQVPARIAELLGAPQIGYARKIEAAGDGVRCERSMDDMIETLAAPFPAVVTVVSEINEPRIPSLMHIMKAKSKPLQEWTLGRPGSGRGRGRAAARDREQPGRGAGPQARPVRGHGRRAGRRLRQCPHQRRRPGEVTMAELLVYSEKIETARELVAGGRSMAAALGSASAPRPWARAPGPRRASSPPPAPTRST